MTRKILDDAVEFPLLVLAGGFGTRLKTVVPDVPKPLAPVGGRPFIEYMLESWIQQGVKKIVFLLHYEARQFIKFFNTSELISRAENSNIEIKFLIEPSALGTGGAVKFALHSFGITEKFLVTNADTWLTSGVKELASLGAPAMTAVRVSDSSRFGSIHVKNGIVTSFREKEDDKQPGWINAGMYLFEPEVFLKREGESFSIEDCILPELVRRKELKQARLDCDFVDIGVPEDYRKFCEWMENWKTAD